MAEYHATEVVLKGQTFKVWSGFTMRTLRAMTEAGGQPSEETQAEWKAEPMKLALYAAKLVKAYFNLLDDFVEDCPSTEIMAAFDAIMEATHYDPFGQPVAKTPAEATAQPTTGS